MGLIPLISLWFGNDERSKLLVVSLAAFYPCVLNTYEGLSGANRRHLEVGRIFLASRGQVFRHILLPGAMPAIFTGLMQATAFAWLSSIGSELFFDPGPGLGNLMLNGQAAFRMEVVLLAVLVIGLTGYASTALITLVSRRVLRWRPVWQA
jgi:sulfonate transport system permease protein